MAESILKRCSRCDESKPITEFYRAGQAGYCIPCEKVYKRAHYEANRERIKSKTRDWTARNKDRKKESDRKYHEEHRARLNQRSAARNKAAPNRRDIYTKSRRHNLAAYREREAEYRRKNRERCNERIRLWKQANPHKLTHYFHRRRAALLLAMPIWANLDAIEAIYRLAQEVQEATGIPQNVDHIVPLLSPIVCGLHCEANLRVLPAVENNKKNNRWWPDMPGDETAAPLSNNPEPVV